MSGSRGAGPWPWILAGLLLFMVSSSLAFLRVAILHPDQRGLAAQALVDAGRAMEQLDRTGEALRLYRELIATYPDQAEHLRSLQKEPEQQREFQTAYDRTAAEADVSIQV